MEFVLTDGKGTGLSYTDPGPLRAQGHLSGVMVVLGAVNSQVLLAFVSHHRAALVAFKQFSDES